MRTRKQRKSRLRELKQRTERIELQDTTMQMPFGYGSLFYAAENKVITPAEAMTIAFHTRYSNWNTGVSHANSYSNVAKALAISKSYVKHLIKRVSDWLEKVKTVVKGTVYKVASHLFPEDTPEDQLPIDKNGNALKFAVPIGKGGPFERLMAGHISWQACWLWLVMKLNSWWDGNDDKAGQTFSLTYDTLVEKTGMSRAQVAKALKELKTSGMCERISERHEKGVYQLYPKPPKTAVRREKNLETAGHTRKDGTDVYMEHDEKHIYSLNKQYRIEIASGDFELKRGSKWKPANRDRVPVYIKNDMEALQAEIVGLRSAILGSSYNDTGSSDNDTGSSNNNPLGFLSEVEGTPPLPF